MTCENREYASASPIIWARATSRRKFVPRGSLPAWYVRASDVILTVRSYARFARLALRINRRVAFLHCAVKIRLFTFYPTGTLKSCFILIDRGEPLFDLGVLRNRQVGMSSAMLARTVSINARFIEILCSISAMIAWMFICSPSDVMRICLPQTALTLTGP